MSILQDLFPSLFEFATIAVNYSDVIVKRSEHNEKCVIIKATRPVDWMLDHAASKNIPITWVDSVNWRTNTDGTLSVWEVEKSE